MKKHLFIIPLVLLLAGKMAAGQISGCTDPLANNFNPSATQNNGSCMYNSASVAPTASFNLAGTLMETSGLIAWNNYIWTHNDSNDVNLYALDSANGNLIQSYTLSRAANNDWEEISQDEEFVYIGDFGNNANGNRTNLKILRIDKTSILNNSPVIDTINYSYSNQTSFLPAGSNNTDFDCEAFVVSADSIYLFTKQWVSQKTSIYSFPKTPGTYIARLRSTYNVGGLITGATMLPSGNLIALSGYSTSLQPFLYLLYDFKGADYFGGNKREISVSLPFHQVEGIATHDGLKYYISNEYFSQAPFITTPQKLHILDLTSFLSGYLDNMLTLQENRKINNGILFPNPVNDFVRLNPGKYQLPADYFIINPSGQVVLQGKLTQEDQCIDISELFAGMYIVKIGDAINSQSFKVIKK